MSHPHNKGTIYLSNDMIHPSHVIITIGKYNLTVLQCSEAEGHDILISKSMKFTFSGHHEPNATLS